MPSVTLKAVLLPIAGPTPEAVTQVHSLEPTFDTAFETEVARPVTEPLVRPDGGISFPLAGDFIVAGKTAAQVRDELVRRLEKYIPGPVVTVAVVRVASYRIYVIGRVNKPGDFQTGRNIDVLQALSIAGGMTPFAARDP